MDILQTNNTVVENDLCPKCGKAWLEPAGVSPAYNRTRAAFTENVVSRTAYYADQEPFDPPWEVWLAREIGSPANFLVCSRCVDADDDEVWFIDDGEIEAPR